MSDFDTVFFNDRSGHTVLSSKEKKGLKFSHISNMGELDELEQMNIQKGLLWLNSQSKKEYLNESFFLSLHAHLFGEVWKWAGKYRTSEKNIGIEAWRVPSEMHKFIEDVKFWLQNNSYQTWSEFLTHFHHRLVSIHPFPNGNGRFSRILTNYISQREDHERPGWWPELKPIDRRNKYIKALRQADQKNYQPLQEFFSH